MKNSWLILLILSFGCSDIVGNDLHIDAQNNNSNIEIDDNKNSINYQPDISIKTDLFPIKTGMTEQQVMEIFPSCKFQKKDAWSYGVDGGDYGVEVIKGDKVLFFYWLHWESNLVDGIVIVSSDYHIDKNVYVGMSFSRFIEKYPTIESFIGLLTYEEGCYISEKNYWIRLDTKEGSRAAKYSFENGESKFIEYVDLENRIKEIMLR